MTIDTKKLVARMAFLTGVKRSTIDKKYEECSNDIKELSENKNALIIRYLCKFRTALLRNYDKTNKAIRYEMKSVEEMEWFDSDNIRKLREYGIELNGKYSPNEYTQYVSKLIAENINNCDSLFDNWAGEREMIKSLFVAQNFNKDGVLKDEYDKYHKNISFYPYKVYVCWDAHDCGNIFLNDGKFLKIISEMNGNFLETPRSRFRDAHPDTKEKIKNFICERNKVVIAVDCENSDVYKFKAMLDGLDKTENEKITKIILFDDYHTTSGWSCLEKFISIPVEYVDVERVTDRKSQVDIKMSVGVAKEYYKNNTEGFIILTSDSDYWALISSLEEESDVGFIVMYEYKKCGQAIKNKLDENGYYYCSIDDFYSANTVEFENQVLIYELKNLLPHFEGVNGKDIAKNVLESMGQNATEKAIYEFCNRVIKTLRIKFDEGKNAKYYFENLSNQCTIKILNDLLPSLSETNGKNLEEEIFEKARIESPSDARKKDFYDKYIKTIHICMDKDGNLNYNF